MRETPSQWFSNTILIPTRLAKSNISDHVHSSTICNSKTTATRNPNIN